MEKVLTEWTLRDWEVVGQNLVCRYCQLMIQYDFRFFFLLVEMFVIFRGMLIIRKNNVLIFMVEYYKSVFMIYIVVQCKYKVVGGFFVYGYLKVQVVFILEFVYFLEFQYVLYLVSREGKREWGRYLD